jgi:hypothetical protein
MRRPKENRPLRHGMRAIPVIRLLALIAGMSVASGCSPVGSGGRLDPLFESSFITIADVEKAIAIEDGFAERYYKSAPDGESWVGVRRGKSSVLVVAGHATSHVRRDEIKPPDVATGALALMVNDLAGATIIYSNHASPSDPNYFEDNDLKSALADAIKRDEPVLVLDLHASHAYRPHDIDLGTMHGASLLGRSYYLDHLAAAFEREGIYNLSQDCFPAESGQTITKSASSLGVPAIQLEISSTYLLKGQDEMRAHRFAQLLQAIVRFIRDVDAASRKETR